MRTSLTSKEKEVLQAIVDALVAIPCKNTRARMEVMG